MSDERKSGEGGEIMRSVAESSLGSGLLNAMISKQRCVENNLTAEAEVFESAIQRFREQITEAGLDPDAVISKRVELLKKSLGE